MKIRELIETLDRDHLMFLLLRALWARDPAFVRRLLTTGKAGL